MESEDVQGYLNTLCKESRERQRSEEFIGAQERRILDVLQLKEENSQIDGKTTSSIEDTSSEEQRVERSGHIIAEPDRMTEFPRVGETAERVGETAESHVGQAGNIDNVGEIQIVAVKEADIADQFRYLCVK